MRLVGGPMGGFPVALEGCGVHIRWASRTAVPDSQEVRLTRTHFAVPTAAALAVAALVGQSEFAPAESATVLVPHRAVYDLTLTKTRGKRQISSVRGRILYDFNGSACEGYALQFRQVSEIDSGEGKVALSDLQATTWEDGDAKTFRFNSKNTVNDRVVDSVDGNAERSTSEVEVKLNKPDEKKLDLTAKIVFPTEHMRRIIDAAKEGKTLLELPVYDGSENGEKTYSTLTVIGKEIPSDEKKPDDAAADKPALAQLRRWPVTISYFEQGAKSGEQLPVYAIGFELYENGISRALSLDYGDFVVSGIMSQLDLKDAAACK
jgi:hypothetical protein